MGTLEDRKRQRIYDKVAEQKRGYHSDETDDELVDDLEDARQEAAGSSMPSPPPPSAQAISSHAGGPSLGLHISHTESAEASQPSVEANELGSGLKRGEDGQAVAPVIVKRKRKPVQRVRSPRLVTWIRVLILFIM